MSERDQTPDHPDQEWPDGGAPGGEGQDDRTRQVPMSPGPGSGYGADAAPPYGATPPAPQSPPIAPEYPAPSYPPAGPYGPADQYVPQPGYGQGWPSSDGPVDSSELGPGQVWGAPPAEQQAWGAPPTAQQSWDAPPGEQQAWGAPASSPQPWAAAPQGQYPPPPAPGSWQGPPPEQTWGPAPGGWQGYPEPGLPPAGPGPEAYGAPEPARRRTGALIALLLVAAVVLAGAGTGLYFLLRSDGDPSEQTAADRAAAAGDRGGSSGSGSGDAAATACDSPPEVTVTDMRTHAMALEVSTRITASCRDGDVLNGPMSVTATSGGDVIATTRWAADDLELDGSTPTEVMFAFNPEDMLLPRDVVRDLDVDITLEQGAASALQPGDARRALELLVEHDSNAFRDDDTAWRAQLGSKKPGMDPAESLLGTLRPNNPEWAGALDWDDDRILREHLELRESFDAKLLWSGDWSSYTHGDYYVTVVDDRFRTSEPALAWCREYNLSRDHCLAQIVSDSRGPDGSTKLQRD